MDFKLRQWEMADLNSLVINANDFEIAKNLTDGFPHPYTREHGISFIEMAMKDIPLRIFAIDVAGEAVGAIGLHPQKDIMQKNIELGYWLAQKYWGQHIMTEAIKKIVQYGFDNFNVTRIYARPYGTNKASQRVLEKAGFTLEAHIRENIFKNGEFLDEMIYAVRRTL
jgi:[ribosomal protein S5]-alanine N-acetyltransferase